MAKKQNELVCSFCGRHESEVELMMPGYTANICNDCAVQLSWLRNICRNCITTTTPTSI